MHVMPRVSVVMATYNWAPVLPFSIASVLDQTYTDFELLVIGDCCTDESREVVASFEDPRVKWHNLAENVGHQSGPNNEGLRRASGSVVAYLGHDDLWLPSHLELLVAAIDAGAHFAHTTRLMVSPDAPPRLKPRPGWAYTPGDGIPPTSVMHGRDLALSVGGWRGARDTGALDPDSELWQRIAQASAPPRWVRRITCVKFPAVQRAGVYRERPHHEQASWLKTIRSHPDPEAAFARLHAESGQHRRTGARRLIRKLLRSGIAQRVLPPLRRVGILPKTADTAEQRRLANRVFKGLDD